ncbi:hypothetical protein D7M11_18040 [Paenibacillus ginsengarvi]|uniref:AraC-type arabinose-binding/dimerisation domain-containing protein n=2 Tax=Paenibacillus ginsengarvi TaxID=400777 RepID=A0A3B0C959_9BACL|nr:hypothetical protein D7M11_18040 [Paenibacillus ginsengarvi]
MDYYSVHFVVDGGVRFAFDGETALLAKGDLFCMFPGDSDTNTGSSPPKGRCECTGSPLTGCRRRFCWSGSA